MDKTSFVFHFEYLNDIPEEIRGQWALFIIDYAQTGIQPCFNDWRDLKTWNAIKNRIDAECQKYHKKTANLRQNAQNSAKNLHSIEKRLSVTDNDSSVSENALSETEKRLSAGVNVNEFVNVSVFDNEFVSEFESAGNQPTFNSDIIKTTFFDLGYSLDNSTIQKIKQSLDGIGIPLSPETVKYAFSVVSKKAYGKGAEKQDFRGKDPSEQKKILCSALLKYPADVFSDYKAFLLAESKKAEVAEKKRAEAKARANPPTVCKCGADLFPKGDAFVCFSCRRTFEIINGSWEVNE